ncbi:MAG: M36 family metallopeptidase [Chitinophagaceae bacterium]|nr:M36 family metallopeptidase [Chitinophagaceae bacterium]
MKKLLSVLGLLGLAYCVSAQTLEDPAIKQMAATLRSGSETSDETAPVKTAYFDQQTRLQFINLEQRFKGIRVFNAVNTSVFRDNILQSSRSTFIPNIADRAPASEPTLTAVAAIALAAKYLELPSPATLAVVEDRYPSDKTMVVAPSGIARQPISAELIWALDKDSVLHLAWNISIDVLGTPDYWAVRVDAHHGEIIGLLNYTLYDNVRAPGSAENQEKNWKLPFNFLQEKRPVNFAAPPPPATTTSASYRVIPFPMESPFSGASQIETDPWKKAGASNNATTNGWHYDGVSNYNYTRGNNVFAYDDSLNLNQPGRADTSSTQGTVLTFDNTPNPNLQPTATVNRRFAIDNLFYWNNIMHDVFYQYGFNESTGNFQKDNLGRGLLGSSGVNGNDPVMAEAQDGSGVGNANFNTPPDGQPGRMQMYLFNSVTGKPLTVNSPASLAKAYVSPESAFSLNNQLARKGSITGDLVLYNDDASGTVNYACNAPFNNISGKIAMIARGGPSGCTAFISKVKNAQLAGAIAVIVADNTINGTPGIMGGTDNSIVIPAVMVSRTDGLAFINALNAGQTINVTLTAPIQFDGDVDNGVIAHEYGHGISNRLTGTGSTCLANYEQGGEGWSDYIAMMMTTDWSKAKLTDGALPKAMGAYVSSQQAGGAGLRTYPYSTDMSINPHTYANVSNNGSYPRTDNNGNKIITATEVHYIGEIWCSAIWDMTWNIIEQEGSINANIYDANGSGGNVKALRLVVMGMQLQGCSPGFLDARNAILKADSILFNYAHKCAIWRAFARRGMGLSAVQGSSNNTTDQTAAFDVPKITISNVNLSGFPLGGICAGTNFTFTATPVNGGPSPQYQWTRNGVNEAGATGVSYTTNKLNDKDTIRCILTTSAACPASPTVTSAATIVTVLPSPAISITPAGPVSFCAGDSATLNSAAATGNQWYLNGSLIAGASNAKLLVKAAGNYTDSLTGSNGCKAGNPPIIVTVNAVPAVPAITTASGANSICSGDSLKLNSSVTSGNQWYRNDTLLAGAVNSFYITKIPGIYKDSVTNSSGCRSGSAAVTVTVSALPPTPVISASGATAVCPGKTLVLTSSAATGNQWYRDGAAITGATATTYTASAAGIYTLIAANAAGCFSAVSTGILLTAATPPATPTITAAGATSFCNGSSVVLNASTAAGYQWYKDATLINGAQGASYTAAAAGNYTVQVSGANGCTAVSSGTTITVNTPSAPVISQRADTLFSSAATGNQWYLNGNALTGATGQAYKLLNSGTYTVKYTDALGCVSALSAPFSVVITALSNTTLNNKDWIVFPNPVSAGLLHIRRNGAASATTVTAQIVDASGQVKGEQRFANNLTWNINKLASGNYWLRIIDKKNVAVYSFIKQ